MMENKIIEIDKQILSKLDKIADFLIEDERVKWDSIKSIDEYKNGPLATNIEFLHAIGIRDVIKYFNSYSYDDPKDEELKGLGDIVIAFVDVEFNIVYKKINLEEYIDSLKDRGE